MVLLACVGGLPLLACACAFAGFLLYFLPVPACPLLRLFATHTLRTTVTAAIETSALCSGGHTYTSTTQALGWCERPTDAYVSSRPLLQTLDIEKHRCPHDDSYKRSILTTF